MALEELEQPQSHTDHIWEGIPEFSPRLRTSITPKHTFIALQSSSWTPH